MDVLCLGSAVIDIVASPIAGPGSWKEKQRIDSISFFLGGDAANQCVRLADAGLKVGACFSIGDDRNGLILSQLLEERGVDTGRIAVLDSVATGTAIVLVDGEGNRNTFSVKGAHSLFTRDMLPDLGSMPELRAVSLASFFSLPLLESDGLEDFLRSAKDRGITVFADLGSDKLGLKLEGIRRFLPYVDYFLPSIYDALDMTGCSCAEEAADVYLSCGCRNVVIKLGSEGCCYRSADCSGYVKAAQVTPVDTTGAGDCMAALFISRILAGDTLRQACEYSGAGATLSVLKMGASAEKLCDEEIRAFLNK